MAGTDTGSFTERGLLDTSCEEHPPQKKGDGRTVTTAGGGHVELSTIHYMEKSTLFWYCVQSMIQTIFLI